jgi:GNAT superfamily N-acetyltransferase
MPLEIRYPSPLEETEIQSIARAVFDQPDDDLDFEHDDALVAWLDGQAVGFAMRFEWAFHPHLSTLEIAVLPEFRRSGIGTALWNELTKFPPHRHWRCMVRENRSEAQFFLEKHGFQVLRRTWMAYLEIPSEINPTLPFGFAWQKHPSPEVLGTLIKNHYVATHQINPPAEFPPEVWVETVLRDHLPESLRVLVHQGKPVAVAALAPSIDGLENTLDLSCLSLNVAYQSDAKRIVAVLLNELFLIAQTFGATQIHAEIDDTSPAAMAMLEFKHSLGACWQTLQTTDLSLR